jgi:hypothetical protein
MMSSRRLVVRVLAAIALLSPICTPSGANAPAGLPDKDGLSPLSAVRPEVRLRKLHLVRPDLIPYPIASEIYC